LKIDHHFHHWKKKLSGCKPYNGILDVLESFIPILVALATMLLFFLLIINPGTLLAIIVFVLVLALLGIINKC